MRGASRMQKALGVQGLNERLAGLERSNRRLKRRAHANAKRLRGIESSVTEAVGQLSTLLDEFKTDVFMRSGHSDALMRLEHLQQIHVQGLHPKKNRGVDQAVQHILSNQYKALIAAGQPLPSFDEAEVRYYSQNGEDGIIQLILAAVGTDTKRTVEICAGDGIENNSTNLIVNHGWTGLLVDGGEEILTRGQDFYQNGADTYYWPPTLRQAWITRDSVNDIVKEAGFDGDIDLLTIDLDGMDYWIWEALDCVNPRIVVTEYNSVWGPDEAKTIPYQDEFVWEKGSLYMGTSLGAMVKLAKKKGYRLVGGNRFGFNAFFVREDLAPDLLPEVPARSILRHPAVAYTQSVIDLVKHLDWADV